MARSKFLQKIINETPLSVKKRVRKYADSLIYKSKEEKPSKCTNCKCQDLEDWFSCHSKK
jgi:hypothetical protein